MMRVATILALMAGPAAAQDGASHLRDPSTVPLPAETAALLRLGSHIPDETYGAAFDRIAVTGEIPVVGPGATLDIRAAADRARVFLAYTQYDLDGDGIVNRREYDLHARMSWGDTLGPRELAILDDEWLRADRDGNGEIRLDEVLVLAREIYPVPDPAPLGPEGEAMLLMDLDNDGFVIWDEVQAVLDSRR